MERLGLINSQPSEQTHSDQPQVARNSSIRLKIGENNSFMSLSHPVMQNRNFATLQTILIFKINSFGNFIFMLFSICCSTSI